MSTALKGAIRALWRRPALVAAIVLILALGMGASTLVFTVLDAVLLRPLPYRDPDRIVTIWNRYGDFQAHSSPPDFVDRRERSEHLQTTAAVASRSMNLSGDFDPRRIQTSRVTSRFFEVLGVAPLVGSTAFPDELGADDPPLAVLSYGLWQSLFGGDPRVLESPIRLDGESYLIQGVLPRGFDFPRGTDVWLPLVFTPEELSDGFRGNEYLLNIGRPKPGVSIEGLTHELEAIAASVVERVPERAAFLERNGWGAAVVPLHEHLAGEFRTALYVLSGATLLVLLLIGSNVANLLLADFRSRERELWMRTALGASGFRVARQLLLETLLLFAGAALVGGAMAFSVLPLLPRFVPHDVPGLDRLSLDPRAVIFTVVVAVVIGIACGSGPAWRSARGVAGLGSFSVTAGRRARRFSSALVIQQVAAATVLLVASGLLFESFRRLTALDPGFETKERFHFELSLPRALYPKPEQRIRLATSLVGALEALPPIEDSAASDRLPLDGERWTGTFNPEDYVPSPGERTPGADFNIVSPGYFETLGIPLLAGRDFGSRDALEAPPVILVDHRTAERFWPDGALGGRIYLDEDGAPLEIVGVVGSVKYQSLAETPRFQLYLPLTQSRWRRLKFTVRSQSEPASFIPLLRRELHRVAPELPLHRVQSLESSVAGSWAFRRFHLGLVSIFGAFALALAAVGLYGLLSRSVSDRKKEMGLRLALGAHRRAILGLVIREGLVLIGLGLAIGALGALLLSGFVRSLLYEIEPADAGTFLLASMILAAVGLVACWFPAARAARLDPVASLRAD